MEILMVFSRSRIELEKKVLVSLDPDLSPTALGKYTLRTEI